MKGLELSKKIAGYLDAKKAKDGAVQWIRDWFEENGKGCNAVVGISGGNIDQAGVGDMCDYKIDNLMEMLDIIL